MRYLIYILVEGISGVKRARLSSLVTVITVAISLFLWGLFFIGSRNALELMQEFKKRVRFEAFLDPALDDGEIRNLLSRIQAIPGIDSVHYVSKREALQIYKSLFGSDYLDILEENPLPASVQIFLAPEFVAGDSLARLRDALGSLKGIDDVMYREKIFQVLNRYLKTLSYALAILGMGLGILSFVLVSNNIRLTVHAKRRIVETMELVGATPSMVWGPFVVQGCLEGAAGGALAAMGLAAVVRVGEWLLHVSIFTPPNLGGLLILVGLFFGLTGSAFAIRRQRRVMW